MVGELQAGDPQSVGPFRLLGRLGAGGMGQVFLGRSPEGRLVAVKVIRTELAADPGFRARFAREVAAARKVTGPFTAPVADADVGGPVPWLATAYIPGPSLAEVVDAHGPLPIESALGLAAGLAQGIEAIHAAGVIHRDLKPSNVLLTEDGPRVIDFGISRAIEASVLTQSGMVLGSPGFMSPEQAEGGEVGPPSDVFSLGALLTFAATGTGPFGAGSTPALVYRVVHHQPDVSEVPGQLRPLAERCLAKVASQRPTAADLAAELRGAHPAAGWLPASLTGLLDSYALPSPVESVLGSPPPVAGTDGPPTVTAAKLRRVDADAAWARGGGEGQSPRRGRRRLLWIPVIPALIAAGVAAAIFVPGAVRDTALTSTRPTTTASPSLSTPLAAVSSAASQSAVPPPAPSKRPTPSTVVTPGTRRPPRKRPISSNTNPNPPPTTPAAQPPPQIANVQTYTQGVLVYFSIQYTDSDSDAEGFGFVGANGAGWAEEQHPFSSPSYGIVGSDSIDYPFNLECGTSQEYQSDVQAWIYDGEGLESQPVVIHLACSD